MTKYGAPEIVGSVGKGGHNIPTDVQIVQELLNDYVEPPMDFLPVTGRCCPQTIQTIVWFQKVNLGHKWPDGRVDPNGETIMYLSQFRILSPSSPDDKWSDNTSPPRKIHPPNATPQQANLFQNRMREVFKNAGWEGEWGTFWDELIHSDIPLVQTIIAGMATGQNATLIAKTYITLRRAEIGRQSALNIIKGTLNSLRPDPFFTLDRLARSPKLVALLGKLGRLANGVYYVTVFVQLIEHVDRGDYHMLFVEAWKFVVRNKVRSADMIEALVGIVSAFAPDSRRGRAFVKIIQAFDFVAANGAGADFLGTVISEIFHLGRYGEADLARWFRLAERLENGGMAIFAQAGIDATECARVLAKMDSRDWENLMRQFAYDNVALVKALANWGKQAVSDYGAFHRENAMLFD